jgi:hypothetical protein
VDTFVTRGLELLQIERDAELEATHQSLEGAASAIGYPPVPLSPVPEAKKDEQAFENCDSITNLIAAGSTTGISSFSLLLPVLSWRHKLPRHLSHSDPCPFHIMQRAVTVSSVALEFFS